MFRGSTWRMHSCVPHRDSSRCLSPIFFEYSSNKSVEMSLDTTPTSACATSTDDKSALEVQLQPELYSAAAAVDCRDHAEGVLARIRIVVGGVRPGIGELRSVRDAESFRANLQVKTLVKLDDLDQRGRQVEEAGPAEGISSRVAENSICRDRNKAGRTKPGIADQVAPVQI